MLSPQPPTRELGRRRYSTCNVRLLQRGDTPGSKVPTRLLWRKHWPLPCVAPGLPVLPRVERVPSPMSAS